MPGAAETKTKYVKNGSLADGVFYDLNQWRSGENKAFDGYVAGERVMEGGQALVGAQGQLDGDTWSVVFTRKFAGGEGDVTLAPGNLYNFGFAIHDDSATGRFHHVSLATRWASTPRATSPPPSSKPSAQGRPRAGPFMRRWQCRHGRRQPGGTS